MSAIKEAILILEDGSTYTGLAVGKIGTTSGEIAFNTGMTGYQEVFTDPSYYGQVLIMNTAHIGNYGVHSQEIESDSMKISGLVVKKFSDGFSRVSANESLQTFMENNNVVGISDIDTRALVRCIRSKGAMNCIISSEDLTRDELKIRLHQTPSMNGLELSSKVSTQEAFIESANEPSHRIALLDLGVKKNIIRCLVERGCLVKVFPINVSFEELMEFNPDGFMLSNGPGDPSAMPNTVELVKKIVETKIPVFGICLGHQILGLSQGLTTEKMFNGHRGINHPIKNIKTGKGEITSQNHGFVISRDSLSNNSNCSITHVHLNDNTVAGIELNDRPVFSVQYHPEASAGPHDSRYLFDQFISNIEKYKN
ncbi:MAG: glutamine-hydrolyzing carbamoyl-phosphate synthase small subunit [Bacteroidetes bacterium]|nr:glutamine-hydrolyzing carbamoyl-phosphate synthase small subunit [Bacteroidota bacterium]